MKTDAEMFREWMLDEIRFRGDGPLADQCVVFTRVMIEKLAKAIRERDQYTPVVLLPEIALIGMQPTMRGYTAPNLVDLARIDSSRVTLDLLLRCDTADELAAQTGI